MAVVRVWVRFSNALIPYLLKLTSKNEREVMRKEAVYALLLNFTLFKGMRCILAQDPRYVRFSCIENGTTVHYNLRVSCLLFFSHRLLSLTLYSMLLVIKRKGSQRTN